MLWASAGSAFKIYLVLPWIRPVKPSGCRLLKGRRPAFGDAGFNQVSDAAIRTFKDQPGEFSPVAFGQTAPHVFGSLVKGLADCLDSGGGPEGGFLHLMVVPSRR
jgi:hypothetical protein